MAGKAPSERFREGGQITYDLASNPIRITEQEKDATGAAAGTFYTETFYDALNRPVARVSNLGNTQQFLYDSRDNLVKASDAMGPVSALTLSGLPTAGEHGTFPQSGGGALVINGRGNTTSYAYDGASRLLRTVRDLRQDGTGASLVVGQIVTQTVWDDNSRVAMRTDPNGNATGYFYDHQDRLLQEIYADGTMRSARRAWLGALGSDPSNHRARAGDPNRSLTVTTSGGVACLSPAFMHTTTGSNGRWRGPTSPGQNAVDRRTHAARRATSASQWIANHRSGERFPNR